MSNDVKKRSLLIIVSSPSGGGKTTLCDMLIEKYDNVRYSVSCTTRKPRGNERDGESYYFMDEAVFQRHVEQGDFLEYAIVHGHRYGTLRTTVENSLKSGYSIVLAIDVQGAASIRGKVEAVGSDDILYGSYLDFFIVPPSIGELRQRLEKRGEDTLESIQLRLQNAEIEMKRSSEYCYLIINDDLKRAFSELEQILIKEWER